MKPTKYVIEYVVQGRYAHGWEDLTAHDSLHAAHTERRVYDANEPVPHRVITRRILRKPHVPAHRIESTVDGRWMVLVRGFQWGAEPLDASGCSSQTWATRAEASKAFESANESK
jgi:hypothetical protein